MQKLQHEMLNPTKIFYSSLIKGGGGWAQGAIERSLSYIGLGWRWADEHELSISCVRSSKNINPFSCILTYKLVTKKRFLSMNGNI